MTVSIVWLDREHAKLFHFSEERMSREQLRATHTDHHTHRLNQDEKEHPKFYEELAERLNASKSFLLVGPGLAKTHFQRFIEERHPALKERLAGCETVDHPTDPEIAAIASRYFQSG